MPAAVSGRPASAPPQALLDVGKDAAEMAQFLKSNSAKSLGSDRPSQAAFFELPLELARPDLRAPLKGLRSALDIDPAKQLTVAEGKNGTVYVKAYTDASTVFTDPNERFGNVKDVEWFEIKPKARRVVPATPHRPATTAEKVAVVNAYGEKLLTQALAQGRFSKNIPMPTDANEKQFWQGILKAEANSDQGVSELDKFAFSLSCAIFSKDGVPDLPKATDKAEIIKLSLLAEATRNTSAHTKSIEQINDEVSRKVAQSHHRGPSAPTPLRDPRFLAELSAVTGSRALEVPEPKQIKDNAVAAQARLKQIAAARHDVSCAVWKIHDDESGRAFAAALQKAAEGGRDVKLIVDANVAARDPGSLRLLSELEAAGVKVLRYRDSKTAENAQNGMHAKLLLTDVSESARTSPGYTSDRSQLIEGGRNAGNPYLKNVRDPSDPNFGWSDSDHQFKGSGALETFRGFAELWNQGLSIGSYPKLKPIKDAVSVSHINAIVARERGPKVTVVSMVDLPGKANQQKITSALVKCLDGMVRGDRVVAGQAYFLGVPAVEQAYARLLARGVKLEVYTNGGESNDVPVLDAASRAVLERLSALAKPGQLKIFEKVGKQTMHDKVMVFESKQHPEASLVMAMSYNQHFRSQIFEVEAGKVMRGKGVVEQALANMATIATRRMGHPALSDFERTMMPLARVLRPHL